MAIFRRNVHLRELMKRITQNRITFAFFIFAFFHCFAQGIMHALLFSVDSDYNNLLKGITTAVQMPVVNHTYLDGGAGFWSGKGKGKLELYMCEDIPKINCSRIYSSGQDLLPMSPESERQGALVVNNLHEGLIVALAATPTSNSTGATLRTKRGEEITTISQQCAQVLVYPQQHMHTMLREDITLVIMQFWLFGMSLFAMFYDSAPHVLATFFARTLMTGWSAYAIARGVHQKIVYNHLVEQPSSPCNLRLFDNYFTTRMAYEIADLLLNCTAWALAAYLSWTILKLYNTQSIKRLGAPKHVIRIHRIFLSLLAALHLESFVLLTSVALWVDQLFNSYLWNLSEHTAVYQAGFVVVCVLILPWIVSGYQAIVREKNTLMLIFLLISSIYLVGWPIMFYSKIYQWTFVMWPFLACHTLVAMLLVALIGVLGIVCRVNFGKGHAQYLYANSALSSSNFASEVFEHDAEKGGNRESFASLEKPDFLLSPDGVPVFSPGKVVSPSRFDDALVRAELPVPTFYLSYGGHHSPV